MNVICIQNHKYREREQQCRWEQVCCIH